MVALRVRTVRVALAWLVLGLISLAGSAQDLSPRAYWPAPKGTRVAIMGFSYLTGDVTTDPSLPVTGVDSRISNGILAYFHTVRLWGRTSNFVLELPFSKGVTEGLLRGVPSRRDFSGAGDVALTWSINLVGAPSMGPAEFQALRKSPRPILGASLKVVAPTGHYDANKLINVGTNRWSLRGELGYTHPLTPKWLFEVDLGVWFFGDNDQFLGVKRQQAPVFAGQLHLVRRFRPGFWGAIDWNLYTGGRSTVGGELRADLQRNSRLGLTLVVPTLKRQAVKLGYSTGVVTESGGDYEAILISYQMVL